MTDGLFTPDQVLQASREQVGAKALNIAQMSQICGTPAAHVVGSAWHDVYREEGAERLGALRQWLASMPPGVYAVRSSGNVRAGAATLFEDGAGLSMAGWFESVVGVGFARLFEAVVSCYEAADSARMQRLTAALGRSPADVSLAVILQPYVPAVRSAVLYTVDPFRPGSAAHMLASGTWGACQALVSGEVTGDTYHIPRDGRGPRLFRTSPKPWMWVLDEGSGLVRRPTPPDRVEASCLAQDDLISLREIGFRLEGHFGSPQDVELVHSGSAWIPVQSRPIQRAAP